MKPPIVSNSLRASLAARAWWQQTIRGAAAILVLTIAGNAAAQMNDAPHEAAAHDTQFRPTGAVYLDALGFALFGPTLGAELAVDHFSLSVYGRWLNVGLLAKELFLNANDQFAFSYGAGLKGRYYFKQGMVGPHVGVAMELLKTRTTNDVSNTAVANTVVIPEFEAGYRFGFGRFFVGLSASAGYAFQASSSVENINGGDQAQYYRAADVSTVYGSGSVDLGLFF